MSKRYGSRGTILTSGRNSHTSTTGEGSSCRRTSYGDVLSKRVIPKIFRLLIEPKHLIEKKESIAGIAEQDMEIEKEEKQIRKWNK